MIPFTRFLYYAPSSEYIFHALFWVFCNECFCFINTRQLLQGVQKDLCTVLLNALHTEMCANCAICVIKQTPGVKCIT